MEAIVESGDQRCAWTGAGAGGRHGATGQNGAGGRFARAALPCPDNAFQVSVFGQPAQRQRIPIGKRLRRHCMRHAFVPHPRLSCDRAAAGWRGPPARAWARLRFAGHASTPFVYIFFLNTQGIVYHYIRRIEV